MECALPSSAPLALVNAFGSEVMVPGAYADAAAALNEGGGTAGEGCEHGVELLKDVG